MTVACPDCGAEVAYRACARGASPTAADLEALEEIVLAAHREFGACPGPVVPVAEDLTN